MPADGGHRRPLAAADAGGGQHAHILAGRRAQLLEQPLGPGQRAAQAVAHPHREGRRGRVPVGHDVEVVVEGRDLEHLGQGQAHLVRQRGEMAVRQVRVAVLDQMQVLDQQVAPPRPRAEQGAHLRQRTGVDLAALLEELAALAFAGLVVSLEVALGSCHTRDIGWRAHPARRPGRNAGRGVAISQNSVRM